MFWSSQLFRWPPVTKSWSIAGELPACCVRTKMLGWEDPFLKHVPEFAVAQTCAAARRPGGPGLGHRRGLHAHHVLVHWPSGAGSSLYTQQLSLTCLLPVACLIQVVKSTRSSPYATAMHRRTVPWDLLLGSHGACGTSAPELAIWTRTCSAEEQVLSG